MTVDIKVGDCRDALRALPDESVHCVVTSPPYFGLRDYGVDGQIGLEQTPDEYVAKMVAVLREVRRVLRDDGTLWLNLGDSYNNRTKVRSSSHQPALNGFSDDNWSERAKRGGVRMSRSDGDLKEKDLIGIPWMVAFALRADGWYLRQDIIWHKPNPMPESVRDRCTKSHEYVFMLSKSARYFFDADAISEQAAESSIARWAQPNIDQQLGSERVPGKTNGAMKAVGGMQRPQARRAVELAREAGLTDAHIDAIRAVGITDVGKAQSTQSGFGKNGKDVIALAREAKAVLGGYYREFLIADQRNRRSVWSIPTMPFKDAHFAVMAPELAETCIKAGCPQGGTVLDPFGGAGTTGLVADRLQRNAILIELNPSYAEMARRRIHGDAPLFGAVA